MAGAIPVRFKRVAEAFEEVAKVRGCVSSSGSEHSPAAEEGESLRDLSDLVNSFLEKGIYGNFGGNENQVDMVAGDFDDLDQGSDSEGRDLVKSLLGFRDDDDEIRREISEEVEEGLRVVGDSSSPEFKRRLMTWLRERGFDAGLCKSKWERNGQLPSGNYEYIDINVDRTRYIIEVSLAEEFDIARPTSRYTTLLENIPPIFVGKAEVLKQVVTLMCKGIKKSMKSVEMHVPPWRRHGYVQAKWFGSYKRTINEVPSNKVSGSIVDSGKKRSVGFVPVPNRTFYCREDFVTKNIGFKVGNLAMAINGGNMVL